MTTRRSSINSVPSQTRAPKSIGTSIDNLYKIRQKRIELERVIEGLKGREKSMRDHILVLLNNSRLASASGKVATASVSKRQVYSLLKDGGWNKFWTWARKDKLGVYVQKRIASEALNEFVQDAKKLPPGVDTMQLVDISLSKR